jgi:hypothetical protein
MIRSHFDVCNSSYICGYTDPLRQRRIQIPRPAPKRMQSQSVFQQNNNNNNHSNPTPAPPRVLLTDYLETLSPVRQNMFVLNEALEQFLTVVGTSLQSMYMWNSYNDVD